MIHYMSLIGDTMVYVIGGVMALGIILWKTQMASIKCLAKNLTSNFIGGKICLKKFSKGKRSNSGLLYL